jgi:hypothetical protein
MPGKACHQRSADVKKLLRLEMAQRSHTRGLR